MLVNQQSYSSNNAPLPNQQYSNALQQQKVPSQNFWSLPNDARVRQPTGAPNQSLSASNMHVLQLSQDLLKLKEQLKKLAERGEEIGVNKGRSEESQLSRTRIEPNNQSQHFFRPNLSADQHTQRRSQLNSTPIYYPQIPSHHLITQQAKPVQSALKSSNQQQLSSKPIDLPPSKRQKIYSFMHSKQSRGNRAGPFIPKVYQKKTQNESNRINAQLRLQLQVKQLKDKLLKLQQQLQLSNQQKRQLTTQIHTLKSTNQALKKQLDSRKQSTILSQPVAHQTYEQEQKKASLIIQKLQAEIQSLKSNNRLSFDEVLKSQLEQNKLLKLKLGEKTQQLQQIKDDWDNQKKTNESLKSELTIQEMKASTELRGRQIKLQIQLSDKANELQTVKRALQTLDLKYKASLNQIREKDDFIMNYIVGRAKQSDKEDIKKTLEQYTINFPQNRSMESLLKEQKEIDQLRKALQMLQHG